MRAETNRLTHAVGVLHLGGEGDVEWCPGNVVLNADVDVLASTGAQPVEVRRERARGSLAATMAIGQVGADADRCTVRVPVHVQEPAERLERQVRRRIVWYGPVCPNGVMDVRMIAGLTSASAA